MMPKRQILHFIGPRLAPSSSANSLSSVLRSLAVSYASGHFFFFQAEDGIRDYKVTGVQTCALPISRTMDHAHAPPAQQRRVARRKIIRMDREQIVGETAIAFEVLHRRAKATVGHEIGRASCRERV